MTGAFTDRQLRIKSIQYRIKVLKYIKMANAGHTGGSLSCIDILNVLYNRILRVGPDTFNDPNRDRYIQSKGHSVEALYVVLTDRGFFPESDLENLCRYNWPYAGHPTRSVPGIEHNTGALGHGLAFGVGLAVGARMDNADYRVFVLLGDGELDQGSNWEAMLLAAHNRLDNLTAIVDRNMLQITGPTEQVCRLEPLAEKIRAFGWSVQEVDGHDIRALTNLLSTVPFQRDLPNMIIAKTIKGKGVSFMEDDPSWHHGVPDDRQYQLAMAELEAQLDEASRG